MAKLCSIRQRNELAKSLWHDDTIMTPWWRVSAQVSASLCAETERRFTAAVFHTSHCLEVSPVRTSTVGKRAFPVSGAIVWNDLPLHVTSAPSLAVFRQRLAVSRSYENTIIRFVLLIVSMKNGNSNLLLPFFTAFWTRVVLAIISIILMMMMMTMLMINSVSH